MHTADQPLRRVSAASSADVGRTIRAQITKIEAYDDFLGWVSFQPLRRAVGGLMQTKVKALALPRALSRLAAAPYDACEKRAARVNGLALSCLWE